jgi:hypothetical protein
MVLAWEPREGNLDTCARELAVALAMVRVQARLEGQWTFVGADKKVRGAEGGEGAAAALRAGVSYRRGEERSGPEFFRQWVYLGTFRRWTAKVTIGCGMRKVVEPMHAPNRFELVLNTDVGSAELRRIFAELIALYRPAMAYVARERFPKYPARDFVPVVGWLTYLSQWFGSPPALDLPSRAYAMRDGGTWIETFPDAMTATSSEQRGQILALDRVLRAAGVLRRFSITSGAATAGAQVALEPLPIMLRPQAAAPVAAEAAPPPAAPFQAGMTMDLDLSVLEQGAALPFGPPGAQPPRTAAPAQPPATRVVPPSPNFQETADLSTLFGGDKKTE